ncbi:MAG: hypothetical protein ACTSR8_12085 [Promethearchaeota archaeon]
MTDKEKIKQRLKQYHIGVWFLLIFLISLATLLYLSRFVPTGTFEVGANVNYAEDNPHYFSIYWKKFLQIICLGPVFGIIYYILMRVFLNKVDKEKGYNRYWIYIIEVCVVILIIMNSMGHFSHLGFEGVNAIDESEGKALDSDYSEMFVYAWFMDEWLGHSMIHITYFLYLVLGVIVELLMNEDERMISDEYFLIFGASFGIGLLNGYIAIMSESGLILLILQITFSFIAILGISLKKVDPRRYPILLAMLMGTIFVVYFNFIEILTAGYSNTYPFY